MDSFRYNVVLTGHTLNGRSKTEIAAELARLIRRDTAFTLRLLEGRPVTIRSSIEHTMAQRYAESLRRISVDVRIELETLEVDNALARVDVPDKSPPVVPENTAASGAPMSNSTPQTTSGLALDFPVGDLEPIYINSLWDNRWEFRDRKSVV